MTNNSHSDTWTIDQIRSFFAVYAENYDKEVELDQYNSPKIIGSWVVEYLQKLAPKRSHDEILRILDIGCGTGQSSKPFFEAKHLAPVHVIGVDASKEMLSKAGAFPFAELICADFETNVSFVKPFHAIVSVGVIDFVLNMKQYCTKVFDSLETGACFGCTVPKASAAAFKEEAIAAGLSLMHSETMRGYTSSTTNEVVYYVGYLFVRA